VSLQSALITIESEAGSHFDPNLCKRFPRWVTEVSREIVDFDRCVADEVEENGFVRIQRRILQMVPNP